MTTTAKDLIQAAAARRTANDPERLFSKREMVGVLSRRLDKYYQLAYKVAPSYFGTSEVIACTDDGWPFPATAMAAPFMCETIAVPDEEVPTGNLLFELTDADLEGILTLFGLPVDTYDTLQEMLDDLEITLADLEQVLRDEQTEEDLLELPGVTEEVETIPGTPAQDVAFVPIYDKQAEQGMPRIYLLGRKYHSVGEAGDPNEEAESEGGDSLLFYFSLRHPPLVPASAWDDADNTLDPSWPEQRNALLVAELALHLAIKDGRGADEIAALKAEIEEETELFVAEAIQSLENSTSRRWSDRPAE